VGGPRAEIANGQPHPQAGLQEAPHRTQVKNYMEFQRGKFKAQISAVSSLAAKHERAEIRIAI
jgi:hypothetical protein